jgi:phage-related minor tail protein
MADNETEIVVRSVDRSQPGFKAAEASAKRLGDAVDKVASEAVRSSAEMGKGISENVKKAGKAVAGAAAAAGAAAGALLAKGFADNMNIEVSNDKLRAQLDLTSEDAAKAGEIAGAVYRDNWGGSIEDVNAALRSVATNLGSVQDTSSAELQKMTESALALASTFDVDVNEATLAAGKLIKNGLAKDAESAFDIITAGFTGGLDASGDFLETLNEYGSQFSKLGIDGADAIGILQRGMAAGARDTDTIADAFKEFSLRAIDGSAAVAEGYKAIGIDAKEATKVIAAGGPEAEAMTQDVLDGLARMKDPVKQNTAGVALFGTQWEDTLRQILPAMDDIHGGAAGIEGATDRMAAAVGDNAASKIETAKRAFEGWTQSMASSTSSLGLVATGALSFGGPALAMASQVGMIATGAAALNLTFLRTGAIMVANTAKTVAMTAVGIAANVATKVWAATQWLLNAALTANPIGIVIMAIVALVAVIILAYRKSETFRRIVHLAMQGAVLAWNMLRDAVTNAVRWIAGRMLALVNRVRETRDRIRAGFAYTYHAIVDPIRNAVNWAKGKLGELIDFARAIPDRVRNAVAGAVTSAWDSATGFIPGRATGGPASGLTMVGERGRELVRLPSGSSVIPNGQTESIMSGASLGASGSLHLTLKIGDRALGELVVDPIRKLVRVAGGDVQAVLGSA